jgi:hypothetical protein
MKPWKSRSIIRWDGFPSQNQPTGSARQGSFDVQHDLYVTVDYQNTVVRVSPGGDIETLATVSDGLDFSADTYFGQSDGQRRFLFWTSGGWNFVKPSLQKLDVGVPGAPLP